jgi:hypothetical protein
MSSAFDLQMILSRLLSSAPYLIVAFGGIVLCMIRQSRPARVRIAVGCALALQLAQHLVLPFVYNHIFQLLQSSSSSGGMNAGMVVVNLIGSLISATVLGLLLYAAFTRDDRPPTGDH